VSGIINGALSTLSYLLALLWELSRAVAEISIAKQAQKTNHTGILWQISKKGPKIEPHVSKQRLCGFCL